MELVSKYGNEVVITEDPRKIEKLLSLGFKERKPRKIEKLPKKKGATKKNVDKTGTETDI